MRVIFGPVKVAAALSDILPLNTPAYKALTSRGYLTDHAHKPLLTTHIYIERVEQLIHQLKLY